MKTTWISMVGLALAAPVFGQTDLDTTRHLRQIQIAPPGSAVSAIPLAGEVTPISGKPYCGIARTVEYSPDGKHVDRSESNHVCRDEQGRTRREANGGRIVSIVDPVGGLAYSLQTEAKTAMKRSIAAVQPSSAALQLANTAPINLKIMNQTSKVIYDTIGKIGGINVLLDPEITPPLKDQFTLDLSNATLEQALNFIAGMTKSYWRALDSSTVFVTDDVPIKRAAANTMQPVAPQQSIVESAREQARRMAGGGRGNGGNPVNVTVDDLGTQLVNGVKAQGVRTTSIISTGTFGNDHEITSASERWVSEDLHVLVKSVYTDSRTGSTVYDLINLSEAPPDRSLFQVPSGYTIQEGGRGGRGGAMPLPTGGR